MADESYSFSTARTRLEAIVTQVRKKDTSLEKSLDLLEEGVRLANACTELIDHADWVAAGVAPDTEGDAAEEIAEVHGEAVDADTGDEAEVASAAADADADADDGAEDAWADDAWADDEVPAGGLSADDDPSADER